MKKHVLAVIDTNVLVASLLSRNRDSATLQILDRIVNGDIRPVFNGEIVEEYREVLARPKFRFDLSLINELVDMIVAVGIYMERTGFDCVMPDPKDRVFYEVALTCDSFLVTGNIKHFPKSHKVVSPAEMIQIINSL